MSLARRERVSSAVKSFLCPLSLVPVALVSAPACGGNAFESRNGVAGGGLAGTSSAVGGSSSTGGSGNSAGSLPSGGGPSNGQAGSATGGAIGRGGTSGGGTGGVDVTACTANTQCEIVPTNCCSCGILGPAESFTAINLAYRAQFNSRCANLDCAGCPPMRAPGPNEPYFYLVATCQRSADAAPDTPGRCVVVDLLKTEITSCKSASDCALRSGTACCSGCSGMPVALNGNQGGALSDLVCPSEPVGCPACAPIFDGYQAVCSDGRCSVERSLN